MGCSICVYCASSDAVDALFFDAAERLGALLAARGDTLVYGGGNIGLMGALARSVHRGGGRVVGVIPERLRGLELAYEEADELVVTRDLRERKQVMESRADAFIALPGGFGTLEETVEVLTLRQLRMLEHPIVLLNTEGFYDPLWRLFEHMVEHRFVKPTALGLIHLAATPADALAHIDAWKPVESGAKWF
jgi:cytokinin riboside 5'-monophosphate phosphoribohydrolase